MQYFLASTALLALLKPHPAAAAAIGANVKAVTLDIVNAKLAPDGFLRSEYRPFQRLFSLKFGLRYDYGEWNVSKGVQILPKY